MVRRVECESESALRTAVRGSVWAVPGMPALLGMTALGFAGFGLLLPTVPLWAVRVGADAAGAGLVNAALMLFTVVAQTMVPLALRRLGWSVTLVFGMILLGAPALAHPLVNDLGVLLALAAIRGLGFGVLTVCGTTAVAELVEPLRRGRAIGAYGLAIAGPQFLLLPTAPWVADHFGFWLVFISGASPLLGVVPAVLLARRIGVRAGETAKIHLSSGAPARGATFPALLRPILILVTVTASGGALLTFAPQMSGDSNVTLLGLLGLMGTSAVCRWRFGALADRYGTRPFMAPLLVLAAAGLAIAAWAVAEQGGTAVFALPAGMALVGISYGGLQNLTLVALFASVDNRFRDAASAAWNIGFDAGTGVGALLVGFLAAGSTFTLALFATAALCVITLPLALTSQGGPASATSPANRKLPAPDQG